MWRNMGYVIILAFAIIIMQAICLAIDGDPINLKIGIVNQEVDYTDMNDQNCEAMPGCKFTRLSCRFLNNLNNQTIRKVYYPDVSSAMKALEIADVWGALYLTDNFTDALVARLALGRDADDETFDQSEIQVWLSGTDQQIRRILQIDLQSSYGNFLAGLFKSCSQNPKLANTGISFNEPVHASIQT